jgi:hypothetical protein
LKRRVIEKDRKKERGEIGEEDRGRSRRSS